MTEKLSQGNPVLGFTDAETVKLDFDDMAFRTVRYWAKRTLKWFRLEGFLILKSSDRCYHVVFNRSVSWAQNLKVVAWVALHSQNRGLIKWLLMQCIKMGSTLRVTPKKEKPSPRVVYKFGCQDHAVKDFLRYRQLIKQISKKLNH